MAERAWGTHGYRLLMTRATALIYDFYLYCMACRLAGTVFAGFDTVSARGLLNADGVVKQHLFASTFALAGEPE